MLISALKTVLWKVKLGRWCFRKNEQWFEEDNGLIKVLQLYFPYTLFIVIPAQAGIYESAYGIILNFAVVGVLKKFALMTIEYYCRS